MTPDHLGPAADEPSSAPRSVRPKRGWRIAISLAAIASVLGTVYCLSLRPKPPATDAGPKSRDDPVPPDPRLSYRGPFRNIHPDVKYVGDGQCVDCHQDIHRTYGKHPMGRSMAPIARLASKQPYDEAHHNPFMAFDILFRVDRRGDRVYHRQTRLDASGKPIYDFAHEVGHVVGSGARGHSYLTTHDGFVFQTPISWFSQNRIWDLSPGFPPWARAGRLVSGACLYCHANRVEPVENTRNRYREPVFRGHAIGCERCHGPGERHVRTLEKDDIVNPSRLEPALREAVCQQCHLEGAIRVPHRGRGLNDFRPGMPLQDFWTVFVRGSSPDEERKAVNHVEQMVESRCFQKSSGQDKMGCITCHDPHEAVAPERRVGYYRDRCMQCHEEAGCSVPEGTRRKKEPEDSCVACHMPRSATSDIVHTASSDHRISRNVGAGSTNGHRKEADPSMALRNFYRGALDPGDKEEARDLGVAIYQLTLKGIPLTGPDGEYAITLLSEALRDYPGDLDAWEAKGKILQTLRRPVAAIDAFEALLARAPRHEGALVTLGTINRDLGRKEDALAYWRLAVEVNPWVAEYSKNLVLNLAERGAWQELRPHCKKWLDLDPASVEARQNWVRCLLNDGRKAEAEAEFAKIRALRPPNLDKLDAWFAEQLP